MLEWMRLWAVATALVWSVACDKKPERSQAPQPKERTAAACDGKPCLPPPNGIKGLTFGMDVEQVRGALGTELSPAELDSIKPKVRLGSLDFDLGRSLQRRPNGERYVAKTSLGPEKAVCTLDFVVESKLSRISCEIRIESGKHYPVYYALYRRLLKRYGPATLSDESGIDETSDHVWSEGDVNLLVLHGQSGGYSETAKVVLTNEMVAHGKLLTRLEREVTKRYHDEVAAKERMKERKQREAEARQRKKAAEWDNDIGPAAEKPK